MASIVLNCTLYPLYKEYEALCKPISLSGFSRWYLKEMSGYISSCFDGMSADLKKEDRLVVVKRVTHCTMSLFLLLAFIALQLFTTILLPAFCIMFLLIHLKHYASI